VKYALNSLGDGRVETDDLVHFDLSVEMIKTLYTETDSAFLTFISYPSRYH
jgi:hypothetical protein